MKNNETKKYIAEFIGTFALVFCGTGAIIVNEQSNGSLGLLGIALTFGIIISAMIYIFGNTSGAHINPAVTIALVIGKLTSKRDALFYILAQILGAIMASGLLKFIFPENQTLGATIPSGELLQSFILEFVLTFFLMLTILGVTSKKEFSNVAGLIIGLVVAGIILFAGPISGGSFNPARSLAPAIVSGNFTALWIYIIASTFGAIIAMLVWKAINKTE
ncbi:MIP/aquaporin family protein [Ichthyenterobacterium magnum]|uniref:Aquaporin Z n=1 Tax=Ichthyenterobacterium magnum TaxID=1230530 RepID=A0A420DM42_9FLAO|nr:aquaporin [Ichthyenterobacterium magnum]RKE95265.1 aquaporin Z [Ichthyenterobacterium magnum]